MKKITKIEKKTKTYDVWFNDLLITLEPEVFLKYRLHIHKEIKPKEYQEIILQNQYEQYYKVGITKLKKMLTQKELSEFLASKGASQPIINQLIENFKKRKYLDDAAYAKSYLRSKENRYGPRVIRADLHGKGISRNIMKTTFDNYNQEALLAVLVPKKLNSIRNKSRNKTAQTAKLFFIHKGFDLEVIESEMTKALMNYQSNDQELIIKQYDKLHYKYKKRYDELKLKLIIKEKLYTKGFTLENINRIIK